MSRQQSAGTPGMSAWNSRKGSRYNSLTEIDSKDVPGTPSFIHSATPARERRKFVSFTVELLREGGPLGLTLATEDDADVVPGRPIYISALQENGLAERTKTIQVAQINKLKSFPAFLLFDTFTSWINSKDLI